MRKEALLQRISSCARSAKDAAVFLLAKGSVHDWLFVGRTSSVFMLEKT